MCVLSSDKSIENFNYNANLANIHLGEIFKGQSSHLIPEFCKGSLHNSCFFTRRILVPKLCGGLVYYKGS